MMHKLIPKESIFQCLSSLFQIGATFHQWKFGRSHQNHFYQPCVSNKEWSQHNIGAHLQEIIYFRPNFKVLTCAEVILFYITSWCSLVLLSVLMTNMFCRISSLLSAVNCRAYLVLPLPGASGSTIRHIKPPLASRNCFLGGGISPDDK